MPHRRPNVLGTHRRPDDVEEPRKARRVERLAVARVAHAARSAHQFPFSPSTGPSLQQRDSLSIPVGLVQRDKLLGHDLALERIARDAERLLQAPDADAEVHERHEPAWRCSGGQLGVQERAGRPERVDLAEIVRRRRSWTTHFSPETRRTSVERRTPKA